MKKLLALTLLSAICVSHFLAAGAEAVTIGSNLTTPATQNNPGCGNAGLPCTATTFDAPAGLVASGGLRSPINGIVTSWTFLSGSTSTTPSVSLRILHPTSGLSFTGAGTSTPQAPTGTTNGPFLVKLPIQTGDAIGLQSSSAALILGEPIGATMAYWQLPNLADGETRMGTSATMREVMVQATVEPQSTTTTKPVQSLKAKKRQKVSKAAITDTIDKSGTISIRAKVRLPSGSARSRMLRVAARTVKSKKKTFTLAAQTKTKIKIKFSKSARKKIEGAIQDSGEPSKAVVTSTATDGFGNSSTATVRFKLIG